MARMIKNAELKNLEPGEDDLALINKYALEPISKEQVYTFKTVIGNNETDDRNLMPFSKNGLETLAPLYVGKTVIKDHAPSAENQIARVYTTEVREDSEKESGLGEPFTELVAKCYMVKTPENAGLIAEIKAGIKREVSTGFAADRFKCSICGEEKCKHIRGMEYSGKICMKIIDNCTDAYELSFVAVPAQPNAGTVKAAEAEADDKALADFEARKAEVQKRLEESRTNFII